LIPHINGPHTSKTTNDFTEMVGELRRKADTNKDGSVSPDEFSRFLDQLTRDTSPENGSASPCAPEQKQVEKSRG
jgi:hypothetical protein